MPDILFPYLSQLFSRSPTILACILGLAAAIIMWKRSPWAALLVCIAIALFLFTSIVMPLVHLYLVFHRPDGLGGFPSVLSIFTITWSCLNGIGIVLLVTAAFAGRSRPALRRFMEDDEYPPITGSPGDTGIQSLGNDHD